MARLPRLTVPGLPHHLIQRGNNRQAIFLDEVDCSRYLAALAELAAEHELLVHAYVLMPNHVHLLATPAARDTLSHVMQALGRRYVRQFNDRHQRTGTLWEGRYRSTVVDTGRYLFACMRYIELNPVRADLVAEPAQYRWSSHSHYCGARIDPLVTEHAEFWALGNTPFERQQAYQRMFEQKPNNDEIEAIRFATQRGWALGQRVFTDSVSEKAGRRAAPVTVGRPRKGAMTGQ